MRQPEGKRGRREAELRQWEKEGDGRGGRREQNFGMILSQPFFPITPHPPSSLG